MSSPEPGELSTVEASRALERSPAWIKRHARELGGRLVDGAYRFPSVAIERRRTTVEKITLGGGPKPDRGALAARVFSMLRAAVPVEDIVERLEADPASVRALAEEWTVCRGLSERLFAVQSVAAAPSPAFDHAPNGDWTCCAGHAATAATKEARK